MKSKVKVAKDLLWSFDDKGPTLRLNTGGSWGHRVEVDPFPCYPHDKGVVEKSLAHVVEASWDIGATVFIGHHEALARSNAWASEEVDYDYDAETVDGRYPATYHPYVFLLGKRIPPHPAVTRYLIAHEYGHCVDYWLNRALALDNDGRNPSGLKEAYRKMRGMRKVNHYGGGTWHKCAGEVLACDFRIAVCGVETEYWPHQGIEHTEENTSVLKWWTHLKEEPEENWRPPKKGF